MKKVLSILIITAFTAMLLSGCGLFSQKRIPQQYADDTFRLDGSIVLDVYVNDVIVKAKIFPTETVSADNLDDYVEAKPVADYIGVEIVTDEANSSLSFVSEKYGDFKYPLEGNAKTINKNLYIKFSLFKRVTEGSMKQDGNTAILLYTGDYERTDLPGSLEECYVMLDEYLTEDERNLIMNMTQEELETERYGLGVWIRDSWLYPSHSKIPELFDEYGIWSKDKMAEIILDGYFNYLNDLPCSLGDLIDK